VCGPSSIAQQCGKHFRGGLVLYSGSSTLTTEHPRILAVPLSKRWSS
jgi:hypothetical protein